MGFHDWEPIMKNTALLTALTIVCVGPSTVVAMTHRPAPSVPHYLMRAVEIAPPSQLMDSGQNPAERQLVPESGELETVTTDMYVKQAAVGDMLEIDSSKVALEKSSNPDVTRYAQMMIDDHGKSLDLLKTAAETEDGPATIPGTLDLTSQGILDELKAAKSGAAFDRAYIEAQISGHEDALKLHRSYAVQGDNPTLKTHAASAVPIITTHLEEAERIESTVRGM